MRVMSLPRNKLYGNRFVERAGYCLEESTKEEGEGHEVRIESTQSPKEMEVGDLPY